MSDEPVNRGSVLLSESVISSVRRWASDSFDETMMDETYGEYRRYVFRKWIFMAVCATVIVLVSGYAVTVGAFNIGFWESYQIMWDHITGNIDPDSMKDYVVVTLRAPRIATAIIAGAGLAVAGVVMQSSLLNPLADPYTTGISAGALFGATLGITMGFNLVAGPYALVINAFVFSLIPMVVIAFVSRIKGSSPTVMIMAGIAIMYIFNALTTVMKLWANPNSLQELYEWQVGSVSRATWEEIPVMLVITVVGIIVMQFMSRKLNVLATGEDTANALGVDANKLRTVNLLVVSLVSASIVAFTGLIGFVGLVAPHISRIFIGSDNRFLIPCSALLGSALLILGDLVGRVIIYPATLQAGVVMSFLGGPMFLWLIMRRKSQIWT